MNKEKKNDHRFSDGMMCGLLIIFVLFLAGVYILGPRIAYAQKLEAERIRQETRQEMLDSMPEEMRMLYESIADKKAQCDPEQDFMFHYNFEMLVREYPELLEENEWLAEYYNAISGDSATD